MGDVPRDNARSVRAVPLAAATEPGQGTASPGDKCACELGIETLTCVETLLPSCARTNGTIITRRPSPGDGPCRPRMAGPRPFRVSALMPTGPRSETAQHRTIAGEARERGRESRVGQDSGHSAETERPSLRTGSSSLQVHGPTHVLKENQPDMLTIGVPFGPGRIQTRRPTSATTNTDLIIPDSDALARFFGKLSEGSDRNGTATWQSTGNPHHAPHEMGISDTADLGELAACDEPQCRGTLTSGRWVASRAGPFVSGIAPLRGKFAKGIRN